MITFLETYYIFFYVKLSNELYLSLIERYYRIDFHVLLFVSSAQVIIERLNEEFPSLFMMHKAKSHFFRI